MPLGVVDDVKLINSSLLTNFFNYLYLNFTTKKAIRIAADGSHSGVSSSSALSGLTGPKGTQYMSKNVSRY
ncbi:hypothetical protein GCM10027189_39300 [Rufibacter soli]